MGHVQTVRGPIQPSDLGRVLTHEHLGFLVPGAWLSGGTSDNRADLALGAVSKLRRLGFGTIVDLTPNVILGWGERDVKLLRDITERCGLNVVAGAAYYLEAYTPQDIRDKPLDELQEMFVREATVGVDDTGIRVGIYGEAATSLGEITPFEEKCLRAIARAHRITGLSINTHLTHGTMALEQIELLRGEGVDLTRVILGHMDIHPEVAYVREVLKTGVNIAFDTLGKEWWDFVITPLDASGHPEGEFAKSGYHRSDESRVQEIAELVRLGFAGQLLLSLDMTGKEVYLNTETHGSYGYSYLGDVIVPRLSNAGIPDGTIEKMLVENPARLLTVD